VIAQCRITVESEGVQFELRKSVDSAPIPLPEGGDEMDQSIRPATQADRNQIAAQVATVQEMLGSRYGKVQLRGTEADLQLLQRLHDDGALRRGRETDSRAVGVVFGEVLAARSPLHWITVEWQGERAFGLQYPNTSIIVFPDSMIIKRIDRDEQINFKSLFRATLEQVEEIKGDSDYQS
jgi:hypothetical protein